MKPDNEMFEPNPKTPIQDALVNHGLPFFTAIIIAALVIIVAKNVDFSQYISFG